MMAVAKTRGCENARDDRTATASQVLDCVSRVCQRGQMRRARLTSLHMVVRNKSDQKADKENGAVFSSKPPCNEYKEGERKPPECVSSEVKRGRKNSE